jgi:hypothetical protein
VYLGGACIRPREGLTKTEEENSPRCRKKLRMKRKDKILSDANSGPGAERTKRKRKGRGDPKDGTSSSGSDD